MSAHEEPGLTCVLRALLETDVPFWDAIGEVIEDEPREGAIGEEIVAAAFALLSHVATIPSGLDELETMAHLTDRVFARMAMRFRDATKELV